jgi:hypothetical protein
MPICNHFLSTVQAEVEPQHAILIRHMFYMDKIQYLIQLIQNIGMGTHL